MKNILLKQQTMGYLWPEAYAECCAYGSKPISIETDEELKCVADFTQSKKKNFNFQT
jgi:hypothetical protein